MKKNWMFFERVKTYREWQLGYASWPLSLYLQFHAYAHGIGVHFSCSFFERHEGKLYWSGTGAVSLDTGFGGVSLCWGWNSKAYMAEVMNLGPEELEYFASNK